MIPLPTRLIVPYVQSVQSMDVPPPYQFPGVSVNAFIWEAPIAQVQAYCDTFLNLGTDEERGFVYKAIPAWPYAMLLFLNYPVMISAAQADSAIGNEIPYADRGIVSQVEVFVAVPVMRYGLSPTSFVLNTAMEWILPFIVVGMPMSAICGREMLGMGKLLADIQVGEYVFPDSFWGSIAMLGWPTDEPGVMQTTMPFLEVETGPVMPTFRGRPDADSFWSLFRSREASLVFDEMANVGNFIQTASVGLVPTTMRTVSLKQIRDAADPSRALYQALVTCQSKYSNIVGTRFYKEGDVKITFHNTGSFQDIVKVFLEPPYTFQPKAGFRFTADIDFDQMRTIHTFPVDRGPGLRPVQASSDLISRLFRPWRGFFGPPEP